jgi:hypothetical protein
MVDQHSCSKCKNPFPYQCEHCVKGVAANAAQAIAKAQTIEEKVVIKKIFIGSGEDAFADLYAN